MSDYDKPAWLGTIPGAPWLGDMEPIGFIAEDGLRIIYDDPVDGDPLDWFSDQLCRAVEALEFIGVDSLAMGLILDMPNPKRPRMKYRARRRHLGYTRTGGQR